MCAFVVTADRQQYYKISESDINFFLIPLKKVEYKAGSKIRSEWFVDRLQ